MGDWLLANEFVRGFVAGAAVVAMAWTLWSTRRHLPSPRHHAAPDRECARLPTHLRIVKPRAIYDWDSDEDGSDIREDRS